MNKNFLKRLSITTKSLSFLVSGTVCLSLITAWLMTSGFGFTGLTGFGAHTRPAGVITECTPGNYTNVRVWLDLRDGNYTTVSGDISNIDGQDSNDNDGVQSTASLRPTLVSSDSDFNSQNSMSFDSVNGNEILIALDSSITQPFFAFIVMKREGTGGGGFGRFFNAEGGVNPVFNNSSSTLFTTSAGTQLSFTDTAPPNDTAAYSILFDNLNGEIRENGTSQDTGTIGTATYGTAGINLGGSATSRTCDCKIALFVVLEESPSTTKHNELGTCSEEYGITWNTVS